MIVAALIIDLSETPRFPLKDCISTVEKAYGARISKRKAYLGRKRDFEQVYGNWDKSFTELPRYMKTLQERTSGTIVEWEFEGSPDISEKIFKYVFWCFPPCVDGFRYFWPVISIDGTHVYGKYDIKLLIVVGADPNGSIFPLAFAIAANESYETWSLFLRHLHAMLSKA